MAPGEDVEAHPQPWAITESIARPGTEPISLSDRLRWRINRKSRGVGPEADSARPAAQDTADARGAHNSAQRAVNGVDKTIGNHEATESFLLIAGFGQSPFKSPDYEFESADVVPVYKVRSSNDENSKPESLVWERIRASLRDRRPIWHRLFPFWRVLSIRPASVSDRLW